MESCRVQTISNKEELEMLLRVYHIREGYLSVSSKEEERVVFTLDCLVKRDLIKQADRHHPGLYGGGRSRYFVSINDKGKDVVRKVVRHYNSLVE